MRFPPRRVTAALAAVCLGAATMMGLASQADAELNLTSLRPLAGARDFTALSAPIVHGGGESETAGSASKHSIEVGGLRREYTLVLPSTYDPQKAYPVIIGFGGWRHTATRAQSYERFEQVAGERAIVVYAQGVNNSWGGAPYAKTSVEADIAYVRELLHDLSRDHTIDANRVFAAGLSNGGGMAFSLACHAPDIVAGIAAVSGAYYTPTMTACAAAAVPTLMIHSDSDDVIEFSGGVRHGAAYTSPLVAFRDRSQRNGCDVNTVATTQLGRSTIFLPSGCQVPTEMIKVPDGGHAWFNDPDATGHIVSFFLG